MKNMPPVILTTIMVMVVLLGFGSQTVLSQQPNFPKVKEYRIEPRRAQGLPPRHSAAGRRLH